MSTLLCRAAILVIQSTCMVACVQPVRLTSAAPASREKLEALWQMPGDMTTRDLFYGPGGKESAPQSDAEFMWLATDTTGYSPGFSVRGPDGRNWSVKLGPEAQTEVVVSRVLWALGYHQPPTYYLASWRMSGGPSGTHPPARFRTDEHGAEAIGEWSWSQNEFIGTEPYHGLIVANVLLNNWDWKTSNNKIYRLADGTERYVVRDLGASLGRTSPSRLFWFIPVRGFGQGSRNDVAGFESQGFIKGSGESDVEFHFDTVYGSVVDLVRPSDVRWVAKLLDRITDPQWEDAFRAAEYPPDIRARYIAKIKAKIAEGLAVP